MNKYILYIDFSTEILVLGLYDQKKLINYIIKENKFKFVENSVEIFFNFLHKNNISINQIISIYTSNGPGYFTGLICSFILVHTISLLNTKINIYYSNSLDIQRMFNKKITSKINYSLNNFYILQNKKKFSENLKINFNVENYNSISKFIHKFPNYKRKFKRLKKNKLLEKWKL